MKRRSEHVANIGPRGATRRRRGGIAWLVIAAIAWAAMLAAHAPQNTRLLLFFPLALGVGNLLQARERT